MKSDPVGTSPDRSENSLRWAKVALGISALLFVVSIFIPDWQVFWIIGLAASAILRLDHLMYLQITSLRAVVLSGHQENRGFIQRNKEIVSQNSHFTREIKLTSFSLCKGRFTEAICSYQGYVGTGLVTWSDDCQGLLPCCTPEGYHWGDFTSRSRVI